MIGKVGIALLTVPCVSPRQLRTPGAGAQLELACPPPRDTPACSDGKHAGPQSGLSPLP